MELPREFPTKIGFLGYNNKNGAVRVSGRLSAKWKHGGCVEAPGKTPGGEGYPAPSCFMQIPAGELLFFTFVSQKGQLSSDSEN